MDLGIAGRNAIVCAASQGLGRACAMALAAEGVNVVINGRTRATLEATAEDIRRASPGIDVKLVIGSVADADVRAEMVETCGQVDILINNAGGPPPGNFRDWAREDWISALDQNMLSAIDLVRRTIDEMADQGFGRIVNITSSSVRMPITVIGLSNAARAGLTGFLKGLVPEVSAQGVTINNLLPGPFDTNRLRRSKPITNHLTGNPIRGRVGKPEELGATCAFICSTHSSYLNGQNILLDGGLNPCSF